MFFQIVRHNNVDLAMIGARLAMDSEAKSDSDSTYVGKNDEELARKLMRAGGHGNRAHTKFLRCIPVVLHIKAPMYIWKQISTYKVATTEQSRSTMHRMMSRPLTKDDFEPVTGVVDIDEGAWTDGYINLANEMIEAYKQADDKEVKDSIKDWVIRKMPMEYIQERLFYCSAETLYNMYMQRDKHPRREWREDICPVIKQWFKDFLHIDLEEFV